MTGMRRLHCLLHGMLPPDASMREQLTGLHNLLQVQPASHLVWVVPEQWTLRLCMQ